MKCRNAVRYLVTACCGTALLACGESSSEPGATPELALAEVDPSPTSPGIFLGSGITSTVCFNGTQTDADRDGLSDACEQALAQAFAPELAYASSDSTGREPHWAAKAQSGKPRIAYLLSYYLDKGLIGCTLGLVLCGGHYGDSETLVLDLYYNGTTKHWLVHLAQFSAHGVYNVYPRIFSSYPNLKYPVKKGGYPRVYVSPWKHANYAFDSECDAGELGLDECLADTYQRVPAISALNIGSRSVHSGSQDCLPSANPLLATNGVTECYWTERAFGGWQGKSPKAGAYSRILNFFGF